MEQTGLKGNLVIQGLFDSDRGTPGVASGKIHCECALQFSLPGQYCSGHLGDILSGAWFIRGMWKKSDGITQASPARRLSLGSSQPGWL